MTNKSIRETHAVAIEDCQVLRMNKVTYEKLLKAQLHTENQQRY